jgi:hypothetical protein
MRLATKFCQRKLHFQTRQKINDWTAGRKTDSFSMRNVKTNFILPCKAAEAKNYNKHSGDKILKLHGDNVLRLPLYHPNLNALDKI